MLKVELGTLAQTIQIVKNKRALILSKYREAKLKNLAQPNHEAKGSIAHQGPDPFDTYDRMVEKIEYAEAEAEATTELSKKPV